MLTISKIMIKANLAGMDLDFAVFKDVDLTGANLKNAKIIGAVFVKKTVLSAAHVWFCVTTKNGGMGKRF